MVTKRVRRRDGVVQRYHVKVRRVVPKRVSLVFDRYKNLDFVDPDEPGAKIRGLKKVFKRHPELYGYLIIFQDLMDQTGGMMDDGYLPPDLRLYLKVPLQDYHLLVQTGIMKPVTYNGVHGYRVNTNVDVNIYGWPFKGEKWDLGPEGKWRKGYFISQQFLRALANMIKKRARITSNKRVKDIKGLKEYEKWHIIQHLLER